MAQLIEIDNLWNGVAFYCPACGAEVYSDQGAPTDDPCEHVLFSWIDAVGEYDNAVPEFQQIVDRWAESDSLEPAPCDEEFVNSMPEHTVLFALIHRGMGCTGPGSTTVVHGIRFPFVEI